MLKEYLLRGSVRDQRIAKLEKRMSAAERSIDSILYTILPPPACAWRRILVLFRRFLEGGLC